MRRQDIRLLALARQGDLAARCEAGRRYLMGADGFPRHIGTGIEYLTHANLKGSAQAARIIAESLALEEILQTQQEAVLSRAAVAGSAPAQVKLGVWLCLRHGRETDAARWFEAAAATGDATAQRALAASRHANEAERLPALLRALGGGDGASGAIVAVAAARQALSERDLDRLALGLRTALALMPTPSAEIAELVADAVQLAEQAGRPLTGLDPQAVDASLDLRTSRGDARAAFALGRALCGIACGAVEPASLATGPNMRKGVALLLRAADAGCDEAWLHLYRMHGDHHLSVANPQMARFCLEKAALAGQVEAQRKLGALILRGADSLAESEQAIQWLYLAAGANDAHAGRLLKSLVLPLTGNDVNARSAIELVRQDDPWLAIRMQLSRHFGLTKLEALCVDPADGLRSWGIVVGKNPFISQIRLSAARAIPSLSDAALQTAQRAAAFFGQSSRDAMAFEGDLRRRSLRQRRAFERHGLDEGMFFANATSMTLEALRLGPKWAFRAKEPLQLALAA